MPREIKYRAWDKGHNKMSYDVNLYNMGKNGMSMAQIDHQQAMKSIGFHCEVMQFTGLKDCKGKEIYEGDLLSMDVLTAKEGTVIDNNDNENEPTFLVPPSNDYMIGEVKFRDGMFGLFFHSDEEGEFSAELDSDMEIIGNKFENPELIS